jgi:hypothetical protein
MLDAAILRSARAAVAAATPPVRRPRRRSGWLGGGALAASLVVAVGAVWQLKPHFDAPALSGEAAAPAPQSAADAVHAADAARARSALEADDRARRSLRTPRPDPTHASRHPAIAPPSPVSPAPLVLDQPADDTPPASATSPDVREAWLVRIRALVASGRRGEARESFTEFRRRHPDAPVPDDLHMLEE